MSNARYRASRRAKEGGAIIFIVAMTLAVLASLGLYALTAASNEIRTSGYERQNTQTQYLAEYAVMGGTQRIDPGYAGYLFGEVPDPLKSSYAAAKLPNHGCYALSGVQSTTPLPGKFCQKIQSSEFAWSSTPLRPSSLALTGTSTGSFGVANMDGDFVVEITDPMTGPPSPGFGSGTGSNSCDVMFTLTGVGRTMLHSATPSWVEYGNASVALTRAQVVVHAVNPCPG